jgi:hypothetical protein
MTKRDARKTTQRKPAWYGWIPDLLDLGCTDFS